MYLNAVLAIRHDAPSRKCAAGGRFGLQSIVGSRNNWPELSLNCISRALFALESSIASVEVAFNGLDPVIASEVELENEGERDFRRSLPWG